MHGSQVKKSITPDSLISFEDGKPYKTLRRHLATRGLTPEQYRDKWGLPADYPMVSPNYSAARSAMAKHSGLGQLRRGAINSPAPSEAPHRGRRRKSSPDKGLY
jgi:predicted transcriptional regulator